MLTFEIVLGLSLRERKIYRATSEHGGTVAVIAKNAALPRMTAHYAVARLFARGLLERKKRRGRFFYQRVSQEELFRRVLPEAGMPFGSLSIPLTQEVGVTLHRGKKNIYVFYEKLCRENAGKRVRGIQTTVSTRYIFENYTKKEIDTLNALISRNNLIGEEIVEEDFFDPFFQKSKNNFANSLEIFLDRLGVTYVLPKNSITFTSDMVLFKNVATFIDWEREVAIEINNDEIMRMCSDLFESFKHEAHKMDYRDLVKKYLPMEK